MKRVRLGKNSRLYYNTGTYEAPVWVEISTVTNVTLNSEFDETEVTSRKHRGKKAFEMTLEEKSIEFDLNIHEEEAVAIALEGFHDSATPKEYLALNGPIETVGSRGIRGTFFLKNWPEEHANDGHIAGSGLQLRPADAEHMPERYVVVEEEG